MSDQNNSLTTDQSSEKYISNDPLDFSPNKIDDPLSEISFELNDDGEMELKGLKEPSSEENKDEQAVEETPDKSEEDQTLTFDSSYIQSPFEKFGKPDELKKENDELKERIKALEDRNLDNDKRAKNFEKKEKLEAAGFDEEQIAAILDITQIDHPDKKDEESDSEDQNAVNVQQAKEVSEIMSTYNGVNGVPSVQEMKPYVEFIANNYPSSLSQPLPVIFRVAENAPFIAWAMRTYPDKMRGLDLEKAYIVGERLRNLYYSNVNKPSSNFDHLKLNIAKKDTGIEKKNGKSTITPEEAYRLSQEKNQQSRNVPGGRVETEEAIRERKRPKSAREVAKASVLAAFGED